MRSIWLFLHFSGVAVWIGGMVFAHFCLRPAAIATLQPPQRVALTSAALGRFFGIVAASLVAIWASGIAMFAGLAASGVRPPAAWTAMAGVAALMTAVFAFIVLRPYPRVRAAVAAGEAPKAAAALDSIRRYVALNLVLGFATIALATIGAAPD